MWFQQDGATAHTANQFETHFPSISFPVSETCCGPLALPIFQRVTFFLWDYLKSRVYAHNPRTLNDLKEAIR